jgi:hypothetical protein
VQPGGEPSCLLETRQGAERAHEGILRQFARILVIADEAITESVHLLLVPVDEHVERGAVPGDAGPHQFFVCDYRRIRLRHVTQRG